MVNALVGRGDEMIKKLLLNFFIISSLFFLVFLEPGSVFPQPKGESLPEIRLGEIRFRVREIGSAPSQVKMLEIQMEILNRSPKTTAPPHSIKVVITPKEMKLPEGAPPTEWTLNPEEVSLDLPLPPTSGRSLVIGLALPEKKPKSITFEIQVNPPEGEKKIVKWEEI